MAFELRAHQCRRWVRCVPLAGMERPSGCVRKIELGGGWERAGALRQVYDHLAAGLRVVCLVMPTGSGKTVVAAELIRDCLLRGDPSWRAVFLVDRVALVGQTVDTLETLGIPIGWVWRGRNEDPAARLQVACVQSLEAGHGAWVRDWIGQPKTLVIIDEAHELALRKSVLPWLQNHASKTWFLLLTATPDSKQRLIELGDVCDALAVGPTYRELIEIPDPDVTRAYRAAGHDVEMGSLVPTTYIPLLPEIDPSGARVNASGEWNEDDLAVPAMAPEILEGVVSAWVERAEGLRTVGFACTVEHAIRQAAAFAAQGYRAAVLVGDDARTGWADAQGEIARATRAAINRALDEALVDVLMSCDAVSKGWDRKPVECGLDLRPMRQRGAWIQKVGRVKRVSPETGKMGSLWLDFSGNTARHGRLEWIEGWTLPKGRKPREKKEAAGPVGKVCPREFGGCGEVVPIRALVCACGYTWPVEEIDLSKFEGFREVDQCPGYLAPVGVRVRKLCGTVTLWKPVETAFGWRVLAAGWAAEKTWKAWLPYQEGVDRGSVVTLSGTVSEHGEYQGRPQTVLSRVKIEPMA